jgi:FkbM family methyltransferase
MIEKIRKMKRLIATVENWPRTLVDHLRLSRGNYICRLRDGSAIHIRGGTDDRHVVFEVFTENIYPAALRPGDTVIDIGAQIGCYTVRAARRGAKVYAFEPFPENFGALERNISLNRLEGVMAFAHAIGSESGLRTMFLPDDGGHTGRYSLFPGRGSRTLSVPCTSLDDVMREHTLERVDILKIDCQGSEYEILYGASEGALARIRRILIECEIFERPDWSVAALTRYLQERGFVVAARARMLDAYRDAQEGS